MKTPQTKEQAAIYIRLANELDFPCQYGHFGCAVWDGGPCSDELTGLFNLNDSEE